MFGRSVIYSDSDEITEKNIVYELGEALKVHLTNTIDIDYLFNLLQRVNSLF